MERNDTRITFLREVYGFNLKIQTIFGTKIPINMDSSKAGRPLERIEKIIQQTVKPMMNLSASDQNVFSQFKQDLSDYSQYSILNSLKANQDQYCAIPVLGESLDIYNRIIRILRLNHLISQNLKLRLDSPQEVETKSLPALYASKDSNLHSLFAFEQLGLPLKVIPNNEKGMIDFKSIALKSLLNNENDYHLLSLNGTSAVTGQKQDLLEMNRWLSEQRKTIKNFTMVSVLDLSEYSIYDLPNVSELTEVDFVILEPKRIIGGMESAGLIIAKKRLLQDLDKEDYLPTRSQGTLLQQDHKKSVSSEGAQRAIEELREVPAINFYRSAITLESISLLNTKNSLKEIKNFLLNEFRVINEELSAEKKQIGLLDDKAENFFALNLYDVSQKQKKTLVDPVLLNKILFDVFGVLSNAVGCCDGPNDTTVYNIDNETFNKISNRCKYYKNFRASHLRLDPFFFSDGVELNIVSQGLKAIMQKSQILSSKYVVTSTGYQFVNDKTPHIWQPIFYYNLKNVLGLAVDELDLEQERTEQLMSQLNYGYKVMYNLEKVPAPVQKRLSLQEQLEQYETDRVQVDSSVSYQQNFSASVVMTEYKSPVQQKLLFNQYENNSLYQGKVMVPQIAAQGGGKQKYENESFLMMNGSRGKTEEAVAGASSNNNIINNGSNLQPSKIFNNATHNLQRRNQNLFEIFSRYQDPESGKTTVTRLWQFLEEFGILNELIQKEDFTQILRKINLGMQGIGYIEFLQILEELAKRIYKKDDTLPSNFDKVEKFYIDILGIDDPAGYRSKFSQLAEMEKRKQQLEQLQKSQSMSIIDLLKECVKKGIEPPKKLSKQEKELYDKLKKDEEDKNKNSYAFKHKHASMRRLNIQNDVEWSHMNKVSAQDWNIALKLGVKGQLGRPLYWNPIKDQPDFDPTQLFDLNERDLYLAQYDITTDMRMKKVNWEKKMKMYDDYGRVREPTNVQQVSNPQLQQANKIKGDQSRANQIMIQEQQREKELMNFLETPANQRKKMK